ncbi:MAG: hypothetical protein DRP85_09335, partial [Candidatus Makaraimicrobium thalassicum]
MTRIESTKIPDTGSWAVTPGVQLVLGKEISSETRSQPTSRAISLTYERGTIVLEGSPWRIEQLRVPELRWDRRIGAYRVPAYRYAVLRATLGAQSVPIHDLDSRWQRRARLRLTAPQLRDYQGAALAAWEAGGQRGVVMLPTGSGKTRVAIAAIAAVARPTLILVPTRSLLAQWVEALSRIRFHPPVSRFGDGTHDLGPLTVATFAAAERHGEELGERFHLLVVDEAHHLAGPVQGELLELFVAPLRLGLTATPPSPKDDPQGAGRLERRVGPIVYRERTSALIDAGHLAGFDVQRLVIELTPGERATYERCREVTQRARVMMVDQKGVLPDWKTMAYEAKRRGPAVSAALREAFAARRE